MKILVVTLHRVWNWGSVLQTYATQEIFKKYSDKVIIADYIQSRFRKKNVYLSYPERYGGGKLKKWLYRIIMFPMRVRLDYIFTKFLKNYINLTKMKFYTSEQLKMICSDYDILVTGSDQVWNSQYNGEIDQALFLAFANATNICISYAASFGMNNIPEKEKEETKRLLERYNHISVRERDGKEILSDIGIDSTCVLDPTLVLDQNYWEKFAGKRRIKEKYLLLYALHGCNEGVLKLVKNISKKMNLKVVSMNYGWKSLRNQHFDQYISPKSPEDFVSLIGNAEFVVADSFHGIAFSINFYKNFIAVAPDKYDSRLRSIVTVLGIQDRIYDDSMSIENALKPMDYKEIEKKLQYEREKSFKYIEEALYE